eukprot:69729-Hanusia_phi.AAC.3
MSARGSELPSTSISVPKETMKRQIKELHPSCAGGSLKSLSNNGIRRLEAMLGHFTKVHTIPM